MLPKQAHTKGEVLFSKDGKDAVNLLTLPEKAINRIRGKISMIFQEPMTSLNPLFTCGNQVMEVLLQHTRISKKTAKETTLQLFEQVQLPQPSNIFSSFPHQLSGGQKQRVMIAMAIACKPAILIADEPTTALDVSVQKNILELIKTLQQEQSMAVMFITHDLDLVAEIADTIIVMYKGRIVEAGNAKELLASPKHDYTKALLACNPAHTEKGKRLPVISDLTGTALISAAPVKTITQKHEDTSSSCSPVLSVKDLTIHYPVGKNIFGRPVAFYKAVDEVSFDVMPAETIGLVGESGSGKTSIGRAIVQLIKPGSGSICLQGKNINELRGKERMHARKNIQIVFQDPYGSLNPRMTIGEAILEPMTVHKMYGSRAVRKEQVIRLLEQVELSADQYNRYPHQFSGGQRQRICIARALAPEPAFIIFDEAVSALDVSVQATVLNLINDLKAFYRFSSLFISHNITVVHYISDRIMVMNKGKIVETGTASQLFHSPTNDYTRQLIADLPMSRI